jgi:DnaJ family protein C protein 13
MLESYGPAVFADALAGDHDTPELIWTHRMRQGRLVPALLQHLGDFAQRLVQVHGRGARAGAWARVAAPC